MCLIATCTACVVHLILFTAHIPQNNNNIFFVSLETQEDTGMSEVMLQASRFLNMVIGWSFTDLVCAMLVSSRASNNLTTDLCRRVGRFQGDY